ncbi:hypothetical protein [Porphyromonas endodontalis]
MITKSYLSLIRGFVTSLSCLALGGLLLVSCETKGAGGGDSPIGPDQKQASDSTQLSVGFRMAEPALRAGGTINTNNEDYVSEVRLILCKSATGAVVFNSKLDFPMSGIGSNTNGYSSRSLPARILPGFYNVYIIANESYCTGVSPKALNALSTESEVRDLQCDFKKDFAPSQAGKKGLLMTARKENCQIPKGHTLANPFVIEAELERVVAKLSIKILRPHGSPAELKKLYVSDMGLSKVPSKSFLFTDAAHPAFAGSLDVQHTFQTTGTPQKIAFGVVQSRYIPEYTDAQRLQLALTIRQEGASGEQTRIIELGKDDNYLFRRNHHHNYVLSLKDWSDIAVGISIADWKEDTSWGYVGEYFNLWCASEIKPNSNIKLRLYTSKHEVPVGHEVILEPINGAKIDNSTNKVSFTEMDYGAFREYTLHTASSGNSLRVLYKVSGRSPKEETEF